MFIKKYLLTKTILYIRNNIRIQYHTNIVDHYEHLRNIDSLDKRNINVDSLDKRNINVGTGFLGSLLCNDVIKLQIKVNSCGIIENAVFKTFGCNGVCSSATVYAFYTIDILHAMHIKNTDIDRHLMIPVKLNCSMLAEDAIKCAVENYKQKNK